MEYFKKEELIEGEVYVYRENFINKITKKLKPYEIDCWISKRSHSYHKPNITGYSNSTTDIRLSTPEEKHWLNTCIKQDKFVTFEEAMKTFIPEYVECIANMSAFKLNGIFETEAYPYSGYRVKCHSYGGQDIKGFEKSFKPSTKEAYDAQFVVKESEFVLPEKWCVKFSNDIKLLNWCKENTQTKFNSFNILNVTRDNYFHYPLNGLQVDIKNTDYTEITFEQFKKYVLKEEVVEEIIKQPVIEDKTELEIWLENTKSLNLSLENLKNYIANGSTCHYSNIYKNLEGKYSEDKAKILFNKWNKEIIEPLPQFKVIETIETITKVENNEGNQFFIGDAVKSLNSNQKGKILEFKYSADKSNIIAITTFQQNNGIGINKLEHYIEPKVEVEPEFVLPELWHIVITSNNYEILSKYFLNKFPSGKLYEKGIMGFYDINRFGQTHGSLTGSDYDFGIEITFEQFKKYVLKEEVKEETLLEKAKRLYPVGTKFRVVHQPHIICEVLNHEDYSLQTNNIVNLYIKDITDGCLGATVYYKGKWAEIIE